MFVTQNMYYTTKDNVFVFVAYRLKKLLDRF